jgi:hypothetical protein
MMHDHGAKCPKAGRVIPQREHWPLLVAGFSALVWYTLRVGPKPSRAMYPCQRVAAPLALAFLSYVGGWALAVTLFRKARGFLWQARYGLAAACALAAAMISLTLWDGSAPAARAAAPWTPTDQPNAPLGVARGIHPGRVVWVRDASATRWNGNDGHWWDPEASDQTRVDAMMAQSIRNLAGEASDAKAWQALFVSHNRRLGKPGDGYQRGEKIVIKINQNTARDGHANNGNPRNENSINGNPHLILALLRQLVHHAGVDPGDIYLYDISRYFPDNIFVPCHREFPALHFIEVDKGGGEGREAVPPEREWVRDVITYKDPARGLGRSLPHFIVDAAYRINMAIMKNHGDVGPTLLAKNHFGTVHGLNHGAVAPKRMGESNPMVDLMAHPQVGEKTMLSLIDALYGADGPDATPRKWRLAPFGTEKTPGWQASLFVSQDAIALESVGFDFVNAEWGVDPFTDNYLHEAALAHQPPSGKPYGPVSLGVHEHWNNAQDQQYSRNLNTGKGIELYRVFFPSAPGRVQVTPADGKVSLAWTPVPSATGYVVKRSPGPGQPYVEVARPDEPRFTDEQVKNGTTYTYQISSLNKLGESAPSVDVSARPGAFVAAVNCGGEADGQFASDAHFIDGGVGNPTTDSISTTGVNAPAPESVYQTERNGQFSYRFDQLNAGATYLVRLHLAEIFFREPGRRVFNVAINGDTVMAEVDLVTLAGGRHKALVREFRVKADPAGQITISFTRVRDNASCGGIELLAEPQTP